MLGPLLPIVSNFKSHKMVTMQGARSVWWVSRAGRSSDKPVDGSEKEFLAMLIFKPRLGVGRVLGPSVLCPNLAYQIRFAYMAFCMDSLTLTNAVPRHSIFATPL